MASSGYRRRFLRFCGGGSQAILELVWFLLIVNEDDGKAKEVGWYSYIDIASGKVDLKFFVGVAGGLNRPVEGADAGVLRASNRHARFGSGRSQVIGIGLISFNC